MQKRFIQIKQKDLKNFRRIYWRKNKCKCPILRKRLKFDDAVVDHKHKRKADLVSIHNGGLIRGVIHRQANILEGKINNAFVRYGLHRHIDLPSFLRNLADYLEHPPIDPVYVHPKSAVKPKKRNLTKTDIARVFKYWKQMYPRRKEPDIPKGGKITTKWAEYIDGSYIIHEQITGKKLKRKI